MERRKYIQLRAGDKLRADEEMHAYLVIDQSGMVIKNRTGRINVTATADQIALCK